MKGFFVYICSNKKDNQFKTNDMTTLINNTNAKLNNWYNNAKIDYNVEGNGSSYIVDGKFVINYTENGVDKVWSMDFYPEYAESDLNYFYNVWMEQAN